MRTKSPETVKCRGCERWWPLSAHNVCHCAQCHETFTGEQAATRHLVVDYRHRPHVVCRTPQSVGLVDAGREYPCWGLPDKH
ncbi:hypothetical protein [Nocardia lijiangensis]|uniref:FDXHR family putative zinc-binding protein n=1 Tax=Nocardia lijiangensis TaxID=299618 RepID=UPI003D702817